MGQTCSIGSFGKNSSQSSSPQKEKEKKKSTKTDPKMAPVVKLMDHVIVMMDILVQSANTQ